MKHVEVIDGVSYDGLLAGNEVGILTANYKIKTESEMKRGTLLTIESDATVAICQSDTTAQYILAQDVEGSSETQIVPVYVTGRFVREKIITAEGDSVGKHEEELRRVSIYLTKEI